MHARGFSSESRKGRRHAAHSGTARAPLASETACSAPSDFTLDRRYWATRARAMAWSAVYSIQFEIGPLSEASIGNVGMRPETTGWVDHVITPTGAFGLIVAEDALDRFLVKWIESRTTNRFLRGTVRLLFNPGRTHPWA